MRGLVLLVVLVAGCKKTPVVEDKSITAALHDTGAGWYPDAYDAIPIPPTATAAQAWAQDPARRAEWAREPDCTIAEICDRDGFAYRAKTPLGDLFVTYNATSVRRAELRLFETVHAFELVYVPDLPYVLIQVELGRSRTDGGGPTWRRVSSARAYDPYPAYRAAFARQQLPEEAARLAGTYVTAFGVEDARFVVEAFRAPIFRDPQARAGLVHELCQPTRLPHSHPGPSFKTRTTPEHVNTLRYAYLPLIQAEQDTRVLAAALRCFGDPFPDRVSSKEIVQRLVRAACTANDDAAFDRSQATDGYARFASTPFEKELRTIVVAEANACADSPYKTRLIEQLARRDKEADEIRPGFDGR